MFDKSFLKTGSMSNIRGISYLTLEHIYEVGHGSKKQNGGAERDRTVGLLNAIQALSQLSYSPATNKLQQNLT